MKKDVVLIRPLRYAYTSGFISTQEPISLCYLAAYLEKEGYDVAVWDLEHVRISDHEFKTRIKNVAPSVVGFGCYTPTISSASIMASLVKQVSKDIVAVVGGPHSSALPCQTLQEFSDLDVVVIGEGEETLLRLVNKVTSGNDYRDIPGIAFRDGPKVAENPIPPLIKDINMIPHPARHLLDWNLYKDTQPTRGFSTHDKRISSMYTSRGCPGKCIFCAARVGFGNKVRFRSVDSVLSEVEECIHKYKIDHIVIQDDTFNLKPKRLSQILTGFKKIGLRSWSCDARVDLVQKDMLKDMVEAGCKKISFGVESGSPRIQKLNKKGIANEQVRNAIKWAKDAGLECVETNFIIGSHPDETYVDLMMSKKLMMEIKPDILFLSIIVPYPGTAIYEQMKDKKLIYSENWDDFVMIGSIPKWRTIHFNPQEMVQYQKKLLRNYYFRPQYIVKRLLTLRKKSEWEYWLKAGIDFLRYNARGIIKK